MRYSVDASVFALQPGIVFGVLIGRNIRNSTTREDDEARLRQAERRLRETVQESQVRELPNVLLYREVMTKAGLNPNRFPPSVEAMFKRVLKGGELPVINALVDVCNAVSLEQMISLGAHDLQDISHDLEVRFSREGDIFLPFGMMEYENVDKGELVFTSGSVVQTRKWIWRQSELGKTTIDSRDIFFQLVGFKTEQEGSFISAMDDIEDLVRQRFQGSCERYVVTRDKPYLDF